MNLHIVLVHPEIPQNTGNVARTCAALGAALHLVEPLGFSLEDRYMKRAGLDYWEAVNLHTHASLDDVLRTAEPAATFLTSARDTGGTPHSYESVRYPEETWLLFGKESTGLPDDLLSGNAERVVRIPMRNGNRCLNVSNAVAVLAYEVYRQHGFPGLSFRRSTQSTGGEGL